MRCLRRIPHAVLILLALTVGPAATEDAWPRVIEKLLELPAAPAPDWRQYTPSMEAPPADDAPLEVLAAWWGKSRPKLKPSPLVRGRLLEAAKLNPRDLLALLPYLPRTQEIRAQAESIQRARASRSR